MLIGPLDGSRPRSIDTAAAIVLVAGALAWAAGSVYNRYATRPASSAMATGMQMLGGQRGDGRRRRRCPVRLRGFSIAQVSGQSWLGWTYLVTFGSLVGFTAYIYLLKAVTPAKASTYAYVNPVVAVFLGWAVAGEPVTASMIAGAAVILGAVAMITLSQSRR